MAYRDASFQEPCSVCEAEASDRCQMCGKYVCAEHLVGDACIDCASEEYIDEARLQVGAMKFVLGGLLLLPLGVAAGLAFGSVLVMVVGVAIGYLVPPVASASIELLRRTRRRRRRLKGPRRRKKLPAAAPDS